MYKSSFVFNSGPVNLGTIIPSAFVLSFGEATISKVAFGSSVFIPIWE